MSVRRVITAGALAALAAAVHAPSSTAALSCARTGTTLDVGLAAAGDFANIRVSGGAIEVRNQSFVQVPCANSPTTANVDTIKVTDGSPGSTRVEVDAPLNFLGGATDAGGDAGAGTNEIELEVSLGAGGADELTISGRFGDDGIVYGTEGVNPNATASEVSRDADIDLNGVELNLAGGSFGSDFLSGAGGAGTGGPFPRAIELDGSFDDDDLRGGAGNDLLDGSLDADRLSGGSGRDTVAYEGQNPEEDVFVDIGAGGANDGNAEDDGSEVAPGKRDEVLGDVENLIGGYGVDTFIGTGARNVLDGGQGADRLSGRGGTDLLLSRDFVRDFRLNCGRGRRDRVRRDRFDPRGKGCELPRRRRPRR